MKAISHPPRTSAPMWFRASLIVFVFLLRLLQTSCSMMAACLTDWSSAAARHFDQLVEFHFRLLRL
jgi:hypothetical protein